MKKLNNEVIMNSIDSLLTLVPSKDHKKALLTIYPMVSSDLQSMVSLRLAKYDELDKSIDDTFKTICECVSLITGVNNITSNSSRKRSEVMARQMVVFCACSELVATRKLTLKSVGAYFDKHFSHALIIYSRQSIANLYTTDTDIRRTMDDIVDCLHLNGLIQSKLCLK
jgi:hypothetical protein